MVTTFKTDDGEWLIDIDVDVSVDKGGPGSGPQGAASRIARTLFNVVNAGPAFTAEVAREAGVSENVARAAFIAALIGDYAVPGVPAGSAAITTLLALRDRGAVTRTMRNVFNRIREMGSSGATEEPSAEASIRPATKNVDMDPITADVLSRSREHGDRQEEWFVPYFAAIDEGIDHEESMDLADAAMPLFEIVDGKISEVE